MRAVGLDVPIPRGEVLHAIMQCRGTRSRFYFDLNCESNENEQLNATLGGEIAWCIHSNACGNDKKRNQIEFNRHAPALA